MSQFSYLMKSQTIAQKIPQPQVVNALPIADNGIHRDDIARPPAFQRIQNPEFTLMRRRIRNKICSLYKTALTASLATEVDFAISDPACTDRPSINCKPGENSIFDNFVYIICGVSPNDLAQPQIFEIVLRNAFQYLFAGNIFYRASHNSK